MIKNKTKTKNPIEKFIRSLRLEGLALALLMVVLIEKSSAPLWILPATFLFFDVSIIGYTISSKVGAKTYNVIHNATLPTILIALGLLVDIEWISILGICWTFHIAVDRTLGYGLKHEESFAHTHLGRIGKKNK
jgi:hypothetical protein